MQVLDNSQIIIMMKLIKITTIYFIIQAADLIE